MSNAASAERPRVAGFVEARTPSQVLGWAWDPAQPSTRVVVQLRADAELVAEALADRPRDDLARNGVGDGAHAYAVDLPPTWHGRAAELSAYARGSDGGFVRLSEPALEPTHSALPGLQRGLEQIIASQRVLLRTLRGGTGPAPAVDDALDRVLAVQVQLGQQIAALEVFVTRLDERMAALSATPSRQRAARGPLVMASGLGAAAMAALAVAFSHLA